MLAARQPHYSAVSAGARPSFGKQGGTANKPNST